MKRYLLSSFTIAAAALLVTSCNDDMDNGLKTGDEGTVTFTAQLPSEMGTRAFADGLTAKHLQYAVYEAGQSTPLKVFGDETTVVGEAEMVNLKKSVTLKLTSGKSYDVIFWADATTDSPYTFNPASQEVSVDYSKVNNNSDNCDAFFKKETITVSGNQSVDVKLTRPFAQVNIGTDDFDAAKASGLEVTQTEVVAKAFATLNLATGEVADEADRTFTMKAIPTASDGEFPVAGGYKYLSMDYLLVGADKATVDVAFNYGGPQNRTFTNVPVQRNYRTNIYGSLLTNTTDFNVVIEPAFATTNYNLGSLYTASQIGGAVTLNNATKLDRTIAVQPGVSMKLNLERPGRIYATDNSWDNSGNNLSLLSVRGANSKLQISGNGSVNAQKNDCYAADVQDGGHLVIDGGDFYGNVSAIYVKEGTAEIKGGEFKLNGMSDGSDPYEFLLNCDETNYNNGTAKIIVSGGKFKGFNPTKYLAPGYSAVVYSESKGVKTWVVYSSVFVELNNSLTASNATVNVDKDYQLESSISIGSGTTLNLTNNATIKAFAAPYTNINTALSVSKTTATISGEGTIEAAPNRPNYTSAALEVRNGGTVNINGNVRFEGNGGSKANYAILLVKGTVNINGGYFHTVGGSPKENSCECILLGSYNSDCYLNITDGVFESDGNATYLINCMDNYKKRCHVNIKGGIFVGFNPADNTADGAHTNYVAPGYKSVETTYNGKQAWKVVKE